MKDCCVLCGKETQYDKETPVNLRKHYVEGVGQLCDHCGGKHGADSPEAMPPPPSATHHP